MKKKSSIARYREISQIILSDIEKGIWQVGDQLPSEQALSEKFSVSRFTIRSALDDLQNRGMISRRRRLGTIVTSSKPIELMIQEVRSVDELFQYPENTQREILQSVNLVPDVTLANFLQCDVGSRWTKIETIRRTHKKIAVCLTEIYVPRAYNRVRDLISRPAVRSSSSSRKTLPSKRWKSMLKYSPAASVRSALSCWVSSRTARR